MSFNRAKPKEIRVLQKIFDFQKKNKDFYKK